MALTAYADADHAGCQDTQRSTSGSAQFLRDKLVSWSSKKQKSIAISTTKAEYIVEKGVVELYFMTMDYRLAEIFTKALPRERFEFLLSRLGKPLRDKMADENVPALAPTRSDDQILPFATWVPNVKNGGLDTQFFRCFGHNHKPTKKDKKDKAHIIPYCRFTKLIICHLGRTNNIHQSRSKKNIHQRSASPFHLAEEDLRLGNLKFVPKGEEDEVFGMPIPDELISNNIRNAPYYNAYLEMVAKHDHKVVAEKEGKKKIASAKQPKSKSFTEKSSKPAPASKPKPAKEKPSKPSTAKPPKLKTIKEKSTKASPLQKADKGKVAKVRKVKSSFQLVDEPNEELAQPEPEPEPEHQEATRLLPVVEGKGKAIVTEEQAAQSLLALHTPKRRSVTPRQGGSTRCNFMDIVTTQWLGVQAIQDEIREFDRLQVWELVPHPHCVMIIALKWIYKVKLDEYGDVLKNKARLVAKGYRQEEGIDFEESFAPVKKGVVELYFVTMDYQLAEIFTKALPRERFKFLLSRLGKPLRDKMADENVPAPAPTRSDDQILPFATWVPIGKSNYNTLTYEAKTEDYSFELDETRFALDANLSREALEITPIDQAHQFVSSPSGDAIMDFVNKLGYTEVIHFVSRMAIPSSSDALGIITSTNVDYADLMWEEFVQAIQTFLTNKENLGSPTKKGRKDKAHIIPYCRFTKLIICHLGRTNNIHQSRSKKNIHQRSASPFHLAEEDLRLGNLKFVPKGEEDEVFGMPIPDELISNNIRNAPYYNAYLEMSVTEKSSKPAHASKPKPAKEKPSKPSTAKPPKPKPVKEKSTKATPLQKADKGKVAKVRNVKSSFKLVDEPDEEPAQPEPEPEHQALHTPKRRSTTDQFIFQRRTPTTEEASTGPSAQPQDDTSANIVCDSPSPANAETGAESDKTNNGEEKTTELDQDQAGSDPGESHEYRAPPEQVFMDEDQAGPDPGESGVALAGPDPEPIGSTKFNWDSLFNEESVRCVYYWGSVHQ
ncbi:retrovirus-related pol polyprotein from transposon TNT 1-94 [Tanacetum coccineum]